jgi:hypothetical protein
MTDFDPMLTRRCVVIVGAASMLPFGTLSAAAEPVITVHRDPNCGCCLGWVQQLQKGGFPTKVLETKDLDAETRLGVPDGSRGLPHGGSVGLCHRRTRSSRRAQTFSIREAECDRPCGARHADWLPGMEGGTPEPYEVVLFGPAGRRSYMRFVGEEAIG